MLLTSAFAAKHMALQHGKHLFPKISANANLSAFVHEDSWSFFHLLKLDTSFLDIPAAELMGINAQYRAAEEVVSSLSGMNEGY